MKYQGINPVYNVWLSKDDSKYFGPGVAMLIEGVKRTGSLSSAAKEIGMAYSKALRLVKQAEKGLGYALTARHIGGTAGGGSRLTPQGKEFLQRYGAYKAACEQADAQLYLEYFSGQR